MEKKILKVISKFVIEKRLLFFLLFGVAAIFCIFSVGKVQVNPDITALLPENTDTRRGLTIIEEEFVTLASANVMVSNILYDTAVEISKTLGEVNYISSVSFDDTTEHYASSSALFSVIFLGEGQDADVIVVIRKFANHGLKFHAHNGISFV